MDSRADRGVKGRLGSEDVFVLSESVRLDLLDCWSITGFGLALAKCLAEVTCSSDTGSAVLLRGAGR